MTEPRLDGLSEPEPLPEAEPHHEPAAASQEFTRSQTFTRQLTTAVQHEPSLKKIQDGAIGSIEMLSMGFYGIIEALKDEIQKSRVITGHIENSFDAISTLKAELIECNNKIAALNDGLTAEIKKTNERLVETASDTHKRLVSMKESFTTQCEQIKRDCMSAVDAVSQRVSKTTENLATLKQEVENVSQETNEQLRALAERGDEHKEALLEQDLKFKDQFSEMTQILHDKALDLDGKIENAVQETTERVEQFDAKHQEFKFEINNELARKADLDDLRRKLDLTEHEQFVEKTYTLFTAKMNENMDAIKANMDEQQNKQTAISDAIDTIKTSHTEMGSKLEHRIDELAAMVNKPVDVEQIKTDIKQQLLEEQELLKEELLDIMKSMISSAADNFSTPRPTVGTQGGNCIACGRGPEKPQAAPGTSPLPGKQPFAGGGFSRVSRISMTKPGSARRPSLTLKSAASDEELLLGASPPKVARDVNSETADVTDGSQLQNVEEDKRSRSKSSNVN